MRESLLRIGPAVALIVALSACSRSGSGQEFRPEAGFVAAVAPKSLEGWQEGSVVLSGETATPGGHWQLENGVVKGRGPGSAPLMTTRSFDQDTTFRLEFRGRGEALGGVLLRGPRLSLGTNGALGHPSYRQALRAPGEWNALEISIRNSAGLLRVGGEVVAASHLDADLKSEPPVVTVDGRFASGPIELFIGPAARVTLNGQVVEEALRLPIRGRFGLQVERGELELRRIRFSEK